ncbi:MAG: replication-associated recombination protein A [Burkholderiales bacterium]|nr:replication-associated recombination protein A [Burkholderiales bacterium]MBP9768189.1 replication-associated recombination protein A [Burkholderiales bacterium]
MQPLAELLRPKILAEVIGQKHLVAKHAPLANLLAAGKLQSMILWGPPGVGKTSLANILMTTLDCHAIKLSAVFSGVKDIKEALEHAEQNARSLFDKPTVLFVDEIHRFNKAQQDAFLHHLEEGTIILIGATTENPSFEINNALLSRMQVYVLESLTRDDLQLLLNKALTYLGKIELTPDAMELLIDLSDGDARRLLNLLELVGNSSGQSKIDSDLIKQIVPKNLQRFDKGGEEFYNQISALHKSVRGSNPDAALYWFGRMLTSGAEPLYIGRRLLRMAWEDIGFADTNAAVVVNTALQTYERLGSPEGELALAGAVIYLAVTNKSNSLELAYNQLREYMKNASSAPVPVHLRNAPTKLMTELGYGREYKYAHDYPNHYVTNEQYFPDGMLELKFYQPSDQGFEQRIQERMNYLRDLDQQAKK